MSIFICPRCRTRVSVANHSGDYVHTCDSGNDVLDQEDVLVKGTWTDYTGSDFSVRTTPASIAAENLGNKLLGTDAFILDKTFLPNFTVRGNNAQIMRQRQHLEYIENPANVDSDKGVDIDSFVQ